jgi:WD40 repeat protein
VWDVTSGQCVHIMQGYAVSYKDTAWSPDGTQLVSGSTDGSVTTWDLTGERPRGHRWMVFGVDWSPDGRFLASGGWDNAVRVWNTTFRASTQIFRDPDYADTFFFSVRWSPDGRLLAGGTYNRVVHVWDVAASRRRWVGLNQLVWVDEVAWSPDGTCLASRSDDGSVYLWDTSNGSMQLRISGHHSRVIGVAWSPEGNRLVSCGGREGAGSPHAHR